MGRSGWRGVQQSSLFCLHCFVMFADGVRQSVIELVWGGGDLDGLCLFGPVILQLYQLDVFPGALLGGDYGGQVIDGMISAL